MRTVPFALAVLLLANTAVPTWLPPQELGPRTCVEGQDNCR